MDYVRNIQNVITVMCPTHLRCMFDEAVHFYCSICTNDKCAFYSPKHPGTRFARERMRFCIELLDIDLEMGVPRLQSLPSSVLICKRSALCGIQVDPRDEFCKSIDILCTFMEIRV